MKYKISTYVLLVVLAGFIIYSCGDKKTPNTNTDDNTSAQALSAEAQAEIDSNFALWFPKGVDPDTTGAFIDPVDAGNHALLYRDHRNANAQLRKEPYGFGFGLNKLRRLIANIDKENTGKLETDPNFITGVRIFLIRKQNSGKPHMDMMFVPCKRDGNNYIKIGDPYVGQPPLVGAGDDGLILNRSSPCPDLCQ